MKKATTLLILLGGTSTLFAQSEAPEENRLLDFTMEYSGNSIAGMTSYAYDTNNLVKEKIHQQASPTEPGSFINDTKENFGYDSLNRQTLHETYVWSDAVFLVYRVAIPRQRFSVKNVFSTRCRN